MVHQNNHFTFFYFVFFFCCFCFFFFFFTHFLRVELSYICFQSNFSKTSWKIAHKRITDGHLKRNNEFAEALLVRFFFVLLEHSSTQWGRCFRNRIQLQNTLFKIESGISIFNPAHGVLTE
jgi:hypothetical protein